MLPHYPFYFKDFASKTMRLTPQQVGIYMNLLSHIYINGSPIPDNEKYIIANARLESEEKDVDFILCKFFARSRNRWSNKKAVEVIKKANEKHQKLSDAGRRGGVKSKRGLKGGLSEAKARHEATKTITNKEKLYKKKVDIDTFELAYGELSEEGFRGWIKKHNLSWRKIESKLDSFRDKCRAKDYKYTDFYATFRSWHANDLDSLREGFKISKDPFA